MSGLLCANTETILPSLLYWLPPLWSLLQLYKFHYGILQEFEWSIFSLLSDQLGLTLCRRSGCIKIHPFHRLLVGFPRKSHVPKKIHCSAMQCVSDG